MAEQPQRLEARLGGELRPVAAGDHDVDALAARAPARRGRARRGSCARCARRRRARTAARGRAPAGARRRRRAGENAGSTPPGTTLTRRGEPEQVAQLAARELRDRDHVQRPPRERAAAAAAATPRRRASTSRDGAGRRRRGSRRPCAGRPAARGWPGRAARARARPRAAGRTACSHACPARCASARRRREHGVGAGPQRGQPRGELARPALDAAELGPHGRAGVDRERARGGARASIARSTFGLAGGDAFMESCIEGPSEAPRCCGGRRSATARSRRRVATRARQPRRAAGARARRSRRVPRAWCARAASCTGRGPTRPSGPTSSTTSSRARGRDDFACLRRARRGRRPRRHLHGLADRPRLLPVGLPRLLRERAPRRQGADARVDGARARPRVRRRSRCTGWRPTSSPATRRRSRSRAAPASGWRATRRATC